MGFYYQDGYLFCEQLTVKSIQDRIEHSPFFLYSKQEITRNYNKYAAALVEIDSSISYAVKANPNLSILKILRDLGSWVTLVSGNEIRFALAAGFNPKRMIFNGNGKTNAELILAITQGITVNIDSSFDLNHIISLTREMKKPADILLRIKPDIDPQVHPYVSTGLKGSKFGISLDQMPYMVDRILQTPLLNLVGLHCHLGSTIDNLDAFYQAMEIMVNQYMTYKQKGLPLKYINLGGGLDINYNRDEDEVPTPAELVALVRNLLPEDSVLILEPGRSIVGPAAIMVCKVIGVKMGGEKNFIVVDGSMTELIRPSLYQAYHHIDFIEPVKGNLVQFDVVGPVCESADFLGKKRLLPPPNEETGVVIFDTGAYGIVMSSNYNARMRPPEYLMDGDRLIQIRKAEQFEDHLRLFEVQEDQL